MIAWLRARLAASRLVLHTTASLVGAAVLNGIVGFFFWWMAARFFTPEAVGLSASAIAAMVFLGRIAQVGLGTTLIGELPRMRAGRRRLMSTALLATTGIGFAIGALFAIFASILAPPLEVIGGDPLRVAIFAAGVSLTASAAVLDQILIGLLKGGVQLVRNLIFSVGKLAFLLPAGLWLVMDGLTIYGAWVAGILLSLLFMGALVFRRGHAGGWRPFVWHRIARLARGATMHHLVNVARFAPDSILPILVTTLLSGADNAAFYVALLLSNYVTLVGQSATLTLFAVGARAPDDLWRQLRTTMALAAVAAVGGCLFFWLAGEQILGLFGAEYAQTAYPAIALLALRGLPILVKDHWVAIQRIRRGMGIAAILTWAAAGLEVGLAVIGTLVAGLEGLAIGWLIALTIEAVILARPVLRAAWPPRGSRTC